MKNGIFGQTGLKIDDINVYRVYIYIYLVRILFERNHIKGNLVETSVATNKWIAQSRARVTKKSP